MQKSLLTSLASETSQLIFVLLVVRRDEKFLPNKFMKTEHLRDKRVPQGSLGGVRRLQRQEREIGRDSAGSR